ncbi:MAG: hypothetical protein HQK50_05910 [Oligoflexia bacterium]|nr:hypothetical protein [Oligoflexia bacterium]MBF0365085.1 hypothetical protein [Oligoflexia bacterium]
MMKEARTKLSLTILITGLLMATAFLSGCSSSSKKEEEVHTSIEKDYIIRESSDNARPLWVIDLSEWVREQKDQETYRFFVKETSPKVDRESACDLAKADIRADIASEIATYVEKSLGSSKEGAASIDPNNPDTRPLREFIEITLAEKTKALIHGAAVMKTYWEKRQFLQSKGAKRDYVGYTCATLIRMEKDRLKQAVDEAANHVINKVDDPATKENVKKALQDVSVNFDKAKQGL